MNYINYYIVELSPKEISYITGGNDECMCYDRFGVLYNTHNTDNISAIMTSLGENTESSCYDACCKILPNYAAYKWQEEKHPCNSGFSYPPSNSI